MIIYEKSPWDICLLVGAISGFTTFLTIILIELWLFSNINIPLPLYAIIVISLATFIGVTLLNRKDSMTVGESSE